MRVATDYNYDQLAKDNRLTFIYKPVKPSRFAVIFDPDKERDLSTDRNRFQSQQQVARTRQNYTDVRERVGDRGYIVLLVEDNLTNQKVLRKYLEKIGIEAELALDGVECTDKLFSKPHDYYSLILVSPSRSRPTCSSHPYVSRSAISTCPTRMATKPAAKSGPGNAKKCIRKYLSSPFPPTSWQTSRTNASRQASTLTSPSRSTSRNSARPWATSSTSRNPDQPLLF